jgi:hypothetical protein
MILRLTLKLAKKLKISRLPEIPFNEKTNPLLDWNANLFTVGHNQYIIVTNTSSLYSIIMYGKGMTKEKYFIEELLKYMNVFMSMNKHEQLFKDIIEPESQRICFSTITNRRVMGSMNDLVRMAKFHLGEDYETPFRTSFLLNETPMSYLNYNYPREEFQKLCLSEKKFSKHPRKNNNNIIHINDIRAMRKKLNSDDSHGT